MEHRLRSALLGLALAAVPFALAAQQIAFTAKTANLRAGPDRMYPIVAVLPPNAQLVVQGCLADYRWCDVSFGYDRGWVYAGNLRYAWGERVLPLPGVAPLVGIVVLTFGFHDYWDLHYRDRPWYPHRHRWLPPRPHLHPRPPPQVHPTPPPPRVRPPAARIHPPPPGVQPAPGQVAPAPPPGQHRAPAPVR